MPDALGLKLQDLSRRHKASRECLDPRKTYILTALQARAKVREVVEA